MIDEAVGAHVENETKVLAGLSSSEQKQLNELLAKLLASLG